MFQAMSPFLNKLLPMGLAFKGLQRLDPRIGRFLEDASMFYTGTEALDFLRGEYEDTPGLRPDEKAVERRQEGSRTLGQALKVGGSLTGAGLLARNLNSVSSPDRNETSVNIPAELPAPAIRKTLPSPEQAGQERMPPIPPDNQAIQMGMKRRTGANNFYPSPEEVYPTSDPDDPYSFLANYDPRLADSVRKMVEKGWTPEKAHEIAHLKYGAYARPIAKMENDMGKSFIQIMKGLFGGKSQSKAALQSNSNQALIAALNAVRESRAKRQPK